MRVVVFCHSLVSDWNHGNAHFLRGVISELIDRGHDVRVLEPEDGWSRSNLIADHGVEAVAGFQRAYPRLRSELYSTRSLDVDAALRGADLVIVHEWTEPALVAAIGASHARRGEGVLLFHDSHHRSVTDPGAMSAYDLTAYDGVLAFGDAIRNRYLANGWSRRAWTWHEAADTRIFFPAPGTKHPAPGTQHPAPSTKHQAPSTKHPASVTKHQAPSTKHQAPSTKHPSGDVVWIGNWGDEERTAELEEFLFTPVTRLGLKATVFGVRYPEEAQRLLAARGIDYRGWLPNYLVPDVFARFTLTVHVPRRPYLESLPGIPTIRPFEALACGIPMISARWADTAGLFEPGEDFLVARDGEEMTALMRMLLNDTSLQARLAEHGLTTIRGRHTCAHRVDQLLDIYKDVAREAVLS